MLGIFSKERRNLTDRRQGDRRQNLTEEVSAVATQKVQAEEAVQAHIDTLRMLLDDLRKKSNG